MFDARFVKLKQNERKEEKRIKRRCKNEDVSSNREENEGERKFAKNFTVWNERTWSMAVRFVLFLFLFFPFFFFFFLCVSFVNSVVRRHAIILRWLVGRAKERSFITSRRQCWLTLEKSIRNVGTIQKVTCPSFHIILVRFPVFLPWFATLVLCSGRRQKPLLPSYLDLCFNLYCPSSPPVSWLLVSLFFSL